MRCRISLKADPDTDQWKNELQEIIDKNGHKNVFVRKQKDGQRNYFRSVFALPANVTIDQVQNVLIEMLRPSTPQSIIRVSQVMARKPLFNNDEISAKNAIADTHELLTEYSDFVYFQSCYDALESEEKYFPIPALWRKWADDNAKSLTFFKELFNLENVLGGE